MQDVIARIFQQETGRVIAALYSRIRDLELVEDAVQDALVVALEQWPVGGLPPNPGAWITTVARNKALDRLRREETLRRKKTILKTQIEVDHEAQQSNADSAEIPDERLKLIFTCCHPALSKEAQVALTLQTLGGLTTPEIASAFLVSLPTMAQRLVRAKRKIREAGIPYRIPPAETIPERIDAVLAVLYLIFNAGYTVPIGDTLIRNDLCQEALRLTRILIAVLTLEKVENAEAWGLLALMLLHDSRRKARLGPTGELVTLEEQDRTLWNGAAIEEGLAVLEHALTLRQAGPYQIQAAISALHAQAKQAEETDWLQIAALYGALYELTPSPVVELNRAVAVAMVDGIQCGLNLLDVLEAEGDLNDYYLFHAARADLWRRSGQTAKAQQAYQRALALCQNATERAFLNRRLAEIHVQSTEVNNSTEGD